MELKNTTTTLVQRLSSTEARLVRVEVLVIFSTLAWVLLQLFGSYRRRYSHGFFCLFVWTVCTVLAPYTIGLLQAGPFRDQTFVLWGTILLLIQVNSDSLSVYNIQDIEQRKRMLVQQVLQIFLVLWLIVNGGSGNKSYSATIWIFYIQSIILTIRKFKNLSKASKKGGLVAHSKVIADYMAVEHQLAHDVVNPKTMEGYSYIFDGEMELASLLPTTPEYRIGLKEVTNDKYTTIDAAWRWIESHSFKHKETAEFYKGIALSFTLFKLGCQLRDKVPNPGQRWKVLADFWAEFILFLAPSDNAEIHAEMLATGGEFMTHLWALLTHAGIVERTSLSSGIDPLGGFNGTTAQDSAV